MRIVFGIKPALLALMIFASAFTLTETNDKFYEIVKNIELFTNVYKELNANYVDEVNPGKLMRTGIDAMLSSLDPFTNYISEADIEGYRFSTEGRYHGIGAVSEKMGDYVTITELYKDQPADKAGLRPGDQIVAVDGRDARNKSMEELNEVMRGFPGSKVVLRIRRPGAPGDFDVTLVRADVDVLNVPYYGMVSDSIGYIYLSTFTPDAARNVENALRELKTQQPALRGIIIDLRNNGGGLLHEAVNLCNIFIPREEIIVSTRGKIKERDMVYRTTNAPFDTIIPLAILINKRSASASEIVSGVMQDYDRGVLIGQRSYGKGLVQNTMEVGYNARIKVTTSKYYIPSGRCIQSVEYENGEPVEIPDARRARFRTEAGRVVLDGGGVKPDVVLPPPYQEGIVKTLVEEHMIFDYVTNWVLRHPGIDSVDRFKFTDFGDFDNWLRSRQFIYDSESEKILKKVKMELAAEGVQATDELAALQARIDFAQRTELQNHREIITDLIEKEIAGRYYYQRGKVQIGLRNDKEVREAISVLSDPERYQGILSAGATN